MTPLEVLAREDVQWGSCDGCGNHHHCPSCGAYREAFLEDDEARALGFEAQPDAVYPGLHWEGCVIAAALGLRVRPGKGKLGRR